MNVAVLSVATDYASMTLAATEFDGVPEAQRRSLSVARMDGILQNKVASPIGSVALWLMAVGANVSLFLVTRLYARDAAAVSSVVTIVLYAWLGGYWRTFALAVVVIPLDLLLYASMKGMTVYAILHDVHYCVATGTITVLGIAAAYILLLALDLRRARASLRKLGSHDRLTDLPNREALIDAIGVSISRCARRSQYRFALISLEFDRISSIDDAWGYGAANDVLQLAAMRLKGLIRAGDCLSRTGDFELSVLLDDLRLHEDVVRVVFGFKQALKHPFVVQGHPVVVSSSFGIVLSGPEYRSSEEMMRDARLAVQRSKGEGLNRQTFFDPQMQCKSRRTAELQIALREALQCNELQLFCQPIVNIESCSLDSFEVLLRWNRPGEGMISPSEFIPIAESTELIVPIGEWVSRIVCQYLSQLESAGAPLVAASMNLSPVHLARPRIADYFRSVLAHHSVDPRRLRVEITESAIVGDGAGSEQAREIAASGIQISVDDFGVGYSCLGYLSRLPIQSIKLDRSFVQGIGKNRPDEDVVRAVVAMASSLSRDLIVEGVETPEQLRFLKSNGCRLAQGYLFARPMPFEQFVDRWIRGTRVGGGVNVGAV